MRYFICTALLILVCISSYSQDDKHTNTAGSEVIIEAPYRLEKYDSEGDLNSLPLHVFVHGSSCAGCNNELMNILVKVKNAAATEFLDTILFNDYSVETFNSLFVNKSYTDLDFGIQSFDESLAKNSNIYTIDFTSNEHSFPHTTYTDITKDYWWFTILIPAEKFDPFGDIIDLEVYCELDWDPDYVCSLRIFRQEESLPTISDWLRGDTHFHGLFTQNSAEVGLPLDVSKLMAKICGLDWVTITDHSCDFDNYGSGTHQNWEMLRNQIIDLNNEEDSFLLIHAIEMSVKNSANDNVHALVYPSPTAPLSMPYFGDGKGDLFATEISIDKLSDSLLLYGAFSYMAHPFAQGDALSFIVDGSVWNLGESDFTANGGNHEFFGTVVCNNLSETSDVFSADEGQVIKPGFVGGQIWNLYSNLKCTEANNPWDVLHESGSGFYHFPLDDELNTTNRFMQNLEATKFIWKKSLHLKNQNSNIENWKFFIEAGSDSHGSFNFSNTDLFMGLSGQVTDNSIGKLSSLVYCPQGAGENGENILAAMKNGNLILSSGPIIGFGIDTDNTINSNEIILGNDAVLDFNIFDQSQINIFAANTAEFGEIISKKIIITTESQDYIYDLPLNINTIELSLTEILNDVGFYEFTNDWFMLRAEMTTLRYYSEPEVYHCNSAEFHSYTNPVWLKVNEANLSKTQDSENRVSFYPNPASESITINSTELGNVFIYNLTGQLLLQTEIVNNGKIDISMLEQGSYYITFRSINCNQSEKIIVIK